MSVLVPQEISMLVTSDPTQGAINRSPDGAYFEIQLQDGLKVPADALNINIAVENATIWWTIPNIKTVVPFNIIFAIFISAGFISLELSSVITEVDNIRGIDIKDLILAYRS